MSRDDELFIAEVKERLGVRKPPTDLQLETCIAAYHAKPSYVLVQLERSANLDKPLGYFVAICARVKDESPAPSKPKAQRHDLAAVACLDCGDTGFVVLIRDVGPDALAGDAAPCHCATGQHKQVRYGTTQYVTGDYDPAVPDPSVPLMSFKEYCESDAGKADPHLQKILRRGGPQVRSLKEEIGWVDDGAG